MVKSNIKNSIKSLINPDLSEQTKITYSSQIYNVYKTMFPDEKEFNIKLFTFKNIHDYVETLPNINRRKTIYAAFLQIVNNSIADDIRPIMLKAINDYKQKISVGVPSKNPIKFSDLKKKFNKLKKENSFLLNEKRDLTTFEIFKLQKMITAAICSGIFVPPRRNMDYILMKINNIDKDKDNYIDMDKQEFVFNKYKTVKSYGKQTVKIPDTLFKLLKKYIKIKIKNSDNLISQRDGTQYTSPTFTQFLNSIFKEYGKIGNNSFRHAFLTEKYGNTKTLTQDLKDMGTSVAQLDTYVD